MNWHEYITEVPFEAFRKTSDYAVYMQLSTSWQNLWAFRHGDLRYKNVPKKVIQEPTSPVAMRNGHPPFCFRFQCLTTGRQSKFIKESEYHLFGITKQDSINGAGYGSKEHIDDKLIPIQQDIFNRMNRIRLKAFPVSGGLWWTRYNEYLKSEEWFLIREKVLFRDKYQCQITGELRNLQVHHLHYRTVGRENIEDLITLTKSAHEIIHDKSHPKHVDYLQSICDLVQA